MKLKLLFILGVFLMASGLRADVIEDWGTIVTPLDEDLTFSFQQLDVTSNFSDEYTFALEGEADATYSVTFNFDYCDRGCGNVAVEYAIYDLTGNMVTTVNTNGTVVLEAGDYSFQVKGTGFGAGNSVDYSGSVTFSALALSSMVSPAPEPPAYLMMVAGILGLMLIRFRRNWSGPRHAKQAALIAAAAVVMTGCQDPSGNMGQTLAQVNGENITASQYSGLLRQLPPDSLDENERRRVAAKMIDQELAVQKAVELKLDRQPRVLEQLERARREILAAAYAEQLASTQPKPSAAEVSNYYLAHPELFAERKVFQLSERVVPLDLRENAAFVKLVKEGAGLEEIDAWLGENSVAFSSFSAIRPAEKLPIQALPRLNQAAPGAVVPFETREAIILYFVVAVQPAPLTWQKAEAAIIQHLEQARTREALNKSVVAMRTQSDIRVFSEFAVLLD